MVRNESSRGQALDDSTVVERLVAVSQVSSGFLIVTRSGFRLEVIPIQRRLIISSQAQESLFTQSCRKNIFSRRSVDPEHSYTPLLLCRMMFNCPSSARVDN